MRKFLLGWILSSAVMYGFSYLWHAFLLTDLKDIEYPLPLFLTLAAVAYLFIGGLIYWSFNYLVDNKLMEFDTKIPFKSLVLGGVVGLLVFLVLFLFGLNFNTHGLEHLLVDLVWQVFEQSMGGLVVALVTIYHVRKQQLKAEGA